MMSRLPLAALLFVLACTPASASPVVRVALPGGFHPQSLAAADFNGDGHVDIAVCGHDGQLAIVSGSRAVAEDAGCGAHPFGMIAADLNGDGRPDLLVANHDTDYVTFVRNDGGGRFTSQQVPVHSKPHPHTVAAADLNGDGHIDLITDSWAENRLTLLFSDGHGGWNSPGVGLDTGRGAYVNVVAADLDGDGNADLIMPNARPDEPHDSVTILFGDGHGHFQPAAQSPIVAGPAPFMVAVADVNGDGRPDILVANYSGHITDIANDGLTWLRNDGHRVFAKMPMRIAGRGVWRVAAGDLNGDGIADAAFINAADDTVTVAYGSKNGLRSGPTIHVMPHPHNLVIANGRIYVVTEERDEVAVTPP